MASSGQREAGRVGGPGPGPDDRRGRLNRNVTCCSSGLVCFAIWFIAARHRLQCDTPTEGQQLLLFIMHVVMAYDAQRAAAPSLSRSHSRFNCAKIIALFCA